MSKIGLIVGNGTGRELIDVFNHSITRIAELLDKPVEIVECDHLFKTYHQLIDWDSGKIEAAVEEDIERLTTFYRQFYRSGGRAIFRTAINAETLYRFRCVAKAVKTVYIPFKHKRFLFVRDETQGFYANDSYQVDDREVRFSGSFSRDNFQAVAKYSLAEADRVLRKPYHIWVVYKHHLFANLIEVWAQEFFRGAQVYQPNHATDLLFSYLNDGDGRDLVTIMGNETGDILHEVIIFNLNLGTRNTLHSKNVYLRSDLEGLVEYQTVHGSADCIGGQGVVNPMATLRALGSFVEEHLQATNFSSLMEEAIRKTQQSGVIGHDAGGQSTTVQIVEAILAQIERLAQPGV